MKKIKKAFTLVELLVVISIIGILATLTLASFTTAQKQTRDTQRKSDLKQYQTLLENYANTHSGIFPIQITWRNISTYTTLCDNLGITCPGPQDPKASATYYYRYLSDNTGLNYILVDYLESGIYYYLCSNGKTGTYETLELSCPL